MNQTLTSEPVTGVKVNFWLPVSLHERLSEMAREADRPVSREVRAALREYVARHAEVAE